MERVLECDKRKLYQRIILFHDVTKMRYRTANRPKPSLTLSINLLKTKRRLLYLKTQFVPRSKHFSSRLSKPIRLCCKWHKSLFVLR